MTRDDIIRMAQQCDCWPGAHEPLSTAREYRKRIERFAALVAAAEREECAKVADKINTFGVPPDIATAIRARQP